VGDNGTIMYAVSKAAAHVGSAFRPSDPYLQKYSTLGEI